MLRFCAAVYLKLETTEITESEKKLVQDFKTCTFGILCLEVQQITLLINVNLANG